MAYRVLTDSRNMSKYSVSFGVACDDGTLMDYSDMLDALKELGQELKLSIPPVSAATDTNVDCEPASPQTVYSPIVRRHIEIGGVTDD